MKTYLIVLLALTGCASAPVVPDQVLAPPVTTVVIPPQFLAPCKGLVQLDKATYNQGQVVDQVKTWSTDATECRKNHAALVDIVKKAFNIVDSAPVQSSK